MVSEGKSAFNWDVYKNRKSALQDLKRNCVLVDTILETEDGQAFELVHSQVISAFGERLNSFISENGTYVDSYKQHTFGAPNRTTHINSAPLQPETATGSASQPSPQTWSRWPGRVKLVRLAKVNSYTLNILVECAYSGFIRTDLASGGIWQVLEVADHYQMFEVIKACCAFLTKNLDASNCVHFYHIGIKHRHTLQRNAWHKIRANFKHILAQNVARQLELQAEPVAMELGGSGHHLMGASLAELSTTSARAGRQAAPPPTDNTNPTSQQPEAEIKANNLATIKYEHFEPLLLHDKLNVENEESVWWAIRLWVGFAPLERASRLPAMLNCIRFPRFKTSADFPARCIWRDALIMANPEAQQQLSLLDRGFRDQLRAQPAHFRDGFNLPCAANPRQCRPRVPQSILLAIGGWQQGQPTRLIESYDLNCNLWFECKKRIMSPLAYHGIEYIHGLLYICGGTDGGEILNEVFTFNPVRGDCQQRPSMREARCYVSTAYLGEHLYAMGGHNGLQRMRSVERLRVQSNTSVEHENWQHVADMNVARSDASATSHKSLIYIAGGLNDIVIESSVEFYNPHDNTWTFITSMLTPRTSFTLLLYKDTLLAIGGNNGSERLSSVEQYNFSARLWSHHSNLRHRRSTFSAALVDQNKLIVVGGYNGQTPFNQVEMFDELAGCWITRQHIRFDRSGLKVVVVNDLPNAIDYTFLGSSGAAGYSQSSAASATTGAELAPLTRQRDQPLTATSSAASSAQTGSGAHLRTRRPLLRSLSARLAAAAEANRQRDQEDANTANNNSNTNNSSNRRGR